MESNKDDMEKKKYGNTDEAKKEEERLTKGMDIHCTNTAKRKIMDGKTGKATKKIRKKRNMEIQTRRKRKKRD